MAAPVRQPEPHAESSCFVTICGRMGDKLLVEHPAEGVLEALTTHSFDRATLAAAIEGRQRAIASRCEGQWVVTGLLRELPGAEREPDHEPFVINAPRGLVLRCGQSVIRLTPDGQIVLRGKNIVSRARQHNQIIGGLIRLN
ncbi:MAG: hypothetical protein KDK70_13575 [Myxococcales bacterium]|nr:hypothetical protein [Myxococcales bacterium]